MGQIAVTHFLLASSISIGFVELLIRLNFVATNLKMLQLVRKSLRVALAAHVSDNRKEQVLSQYSLELFLCSIRIISILCLVACIPLFIVIFDVTVGRTFLVFLLAPVGFVTASLTGLLWIYFRRKIFE